MCAVTHGYALSIHLEFGGFDLDHRSWLVDFGSLRSLKQEMEDLFDHAHLLAQDDPHYEQIKALGTAGISKITEVERTGCEGLSDFIFEHLNDGWLKINGYGDRIICTKVEVRETGANMAMRELAFDDYQRFCGQFKTPELPRNGVLQKTSQGSVFYTENCVMTTHMIHGDRGTGFVYAGRRYLHLQSAVNDMVSKIWENRNAV